MRLTYEELDRVSIDFAKEATSKLSTFSKDLKPDLDVEPVKEPWGDQTVENAFQVFMMEALLSVITVDRPEQEK